ncbi:MAG TPA: pilus assembly PilX N-terminal domain-containing protein [Thermodesulfobacteriota bacterium]|nr:pilus assembly PilX N-terminal domain-containing protein [Thermodesulfobacteriota bacterium]
MLRRPTPLGVGTPRNDKSAGIKQERGDEKGFVLVLAIIIMAAMTAIGLAVVTTSTTDMFIARNEVESKNAFYLAQSGMEEALGRMHLRATNARFVGENSAQKAYRKLSTMPVAIYGAGFPGTPGNSFSSSVLNVAGLGGTYNVTVDYAREEAGTWSDDGGTFNDDEGHIPGNEVVRYCTGFGFSGTGVPTNCDSGQPVYKVTSTGTTSSGTVATIVAYAASSMLNVLPPGDTILFTEGGITIGPAANATINGRIASFSGSVTNCQIAKNCNDRSGDIPGWSPLWTAGGMTDYIGVNITELKNMADFPSPYDQSGGNVNYSTNGQWGTVCNEGTVNDTTDPAVKSAHDCDNESKIIYIDNAGKTANLAANSTGRGILVVTGDLDLAGGVLWEGMIYVMGDLSISGDVTVFGTVMVDGGAASVDGAMSANDVNVNGGFNVFGSTEIADGVGDQVGAPKILRWHRE